MAKHMGRLQIHPQLPKTQNGRSMQSTKPNRTRMSSSNGKLPILIQQRQNKSIHLRQLEIHRRKLPTIHRFRRG